MPKRTIESALDQINKQLDYIVELKTRIAELEKENRNLMQELGGCKKYANQLFETHYGTEKVGGERDATTNVG